MTNNLGHTQSAGMTKVVTEKEDQTTHSLKTSAIQ